MGSEDSKDSADGSKKQARPRASTADAAYRTPLAGSRAPTPDKCIASTPQHQQTPSPVTPARSSCTAGAFSCPPPAAFQDCRLTSTPSMHRTAVPIGNCAYWTTPPPPSSYVMQTKPNAPLNSPGVNFHHSSCAPYQSPVRAGALPTANQSQPQVYSAMPPLIPKQQLLPLPDMITKNQLRAYQQSGPVVTNVQQPLRRGVLPPTSSFPQENYMPLSAQLNSQKRCFPFDQSAAYANQYPISTPTAPYPFSQYSFIPTATATSSSSYNTVHGPASLNPGSSYSNYSTSPAIPLPPAPEPALIAPPVCTPTALRSFSRTDGSPSAKRPRTASEPRNNDNSPFQAYSAPQQQSTAGPSQASQQPTARRSLPVNMNTGVAENGGVLNIVPQMSSARDWTNYLIQQSTSTEPVRNRYSQTQQPSEPVSYPSVPATAATVDYPSTGYSSVRCLNTPNGSSSDGSASGSGALAELCRPSFLTTIGAGSPIVPKYGFEQGLALVAQQHSGPNGGYYCAPLDARAGDAPVTSFLPSPVSHPDLIDSAALYSSLNLVNGNN